MYYSIKKIMEDGERDILLISSYAYKIGQSEGVLPSEELLRHRQCLERNEARILRLLETAYLLGQRDAYQKVLNANTKST